MSADQLPLDKVALRDAYHASNLVASQRARWCADDPGAELNTCRYCGRRWQRWAGSRLDGHAACIVTEDFKRYVAALLGTPTVTYQVVADAVGVTPAIVHAWMRTLATARRGR